MAVKHHSKKTRKPAVRRLQSTDGLLTDLNEIGMLIGSMCAVARELVKSDRLGRLDVRQLAMAIHSNGEKADELLSRAWDRLFEADQETSQKFLDGLAGGNVIALRPPRAD